MNGIPTFWWHVAQVVIGVTILGAITFSIVRTTKNERIIVKEGGSVVYQWKDAQIKPSFGGCVTLKTEKLKENK